MAETLNFLPQETQHPAFNAIESRMSALGEKGGGGPRPPFRLNVANTRKATVTRPSGCRTRATPRRC
jgi:hypothetical protein